MRFFEYLCPSHYSNKLIFQQKNIFTTLLVVKLGVIHLMNCKGNKLHVNFLQSLRDLFSLLQTSLKFGL